MWCSHYLGVFLGIIGLAEVVKMVAFEGSGGIAMTSTVVRGLVDFNDIWDSLFFCFPFIYGGFISNFVMLELATIGIYLLKRNGISVQYLWFLILLSSLVYFISFESSKSRILFNIPFSFFGSLTLYWIYERRSFYLAIFIIFYSLFYFFISVGSLVW